MYIERLAEDRIATLRHWIDLEQIDLNQAQESVEWWEEQLNIHQTELNELESLVKDDK